MIISDHGPGEERVVWLINFVLVEMAVTVGE
jgi:hypothetical protein